MKKVLCLLAVMLSVFATNATAQSQDKPKMVFIVNGKFFSALPKSLKQGNTPQGTRFFMISTPNGNSAMAMHLPTAVPDEILRDTIAVEQVNEGAELLRRFEEMRNKVEKTAAQAQESAVALKEGALFPRFSATDINGKTWSNDDVKGKVMVLNLWFTGCGPCRAEMPELSAWKNEMPEVMFFSSTYEKPEIARPVLEKYKFNWIPLVNDTFFERFVGDNGYPLTVVVDRQGKVAKVQYGTSAEKLQAMKDLVKRLVETN